VEVSAQARNWSLPASGLERIAAAAPPGWTVDLLDEATPLHTDAGHIVTRAAMDAAPEMEAYFGWGIAEELFAAAPRLRWVHSAAAGVGRSLFPAMVASDVVFTNSAGTTGESIAEHVVGGVLHFLRGFDHAVELRRAARWDKTPFTDDRAAVRELCECRVLILGTGGLGEAIARRFRALGTAKVTGVRRRLHLAPPASFDEVIALEELDRALPGSDVVILAAPLTPETRGILGARRIAALPRGAIVANVARGALLDEEALAQGLAGGQIRGAVLDVFQEEPLPAASRLWSLPNALVTPHVAYVSPRLYWRRAVDLFLDNWSRYVRGAPLRNVVDKDAGY
ncbi:MAG TPA: D-2-hydroxyacid dehydrogenase, partial [Gemmatimonadaceae bacterium]|nr:D-2-hydroxyacid dehydrogenase [Gemmatimonadaceae bacterium]